MTNEQLAILKSAEREILLCALEASRDSLHQLRAPRTEAHQGLRGDCNIMGRCPDTHYAYTGEYEALVPFVKILESLDEQIAELKGRSDATN